MNKSYKYDLGPRQETEVEVDFDAKVGIGESLKIGAEGSSLAVPVVPVREILVPRLTEVSTFDDVERAISAVNFDPLCWTAKSLPRFAFR